MSRKAFLYLLPLFALYCVAFLFLAKSSLDYGDESRYAMYAENLTKGFYAPADTRFLWNGPGYPMLLAPFAFFKVSWIYAKMLNPAFIFIAVCLFFSVIRRFASEKMSLFFAYLFGLYPPFFAEMQYLLTEPLALMLTALFAALTWKLFESGKYRYILPAAMSFALLALTKVLFGYVALALLLLSLATLKWSRTMRMAMPVYLISLALCVPYLSYTYHLTGKAFCWAQSGSMAMYWLTSTDPDDYGSWFSDADVLSRPELAYNKSFVESTLELDYVQKDRVWKQKAIDNMIQHPRKLLMNYAANLGRLFLNLPFSYKYQNPRTLLYTVPNSIILAAICFVFYPLLKLRRLLPAGVMHGCVIFLVFIFGESLVAAEARYLCTILPFLFIVLVYTATNLIKVEIRRP